jgi:hypothetical protein
MQRVFLGADARSLRGLLVEDESSDYVQAAAIRRIASRRKQE